MNWGQKMLTVFIVFAAGMIYLVYRCMHVNTALVTKEYYKEELKYQDIIEGTKMANALREKVQLVQDGDVITVQLPVEMKNEKISGNIWFYCAADVKKDRHVSIETNPEAMQRIDKKILLPGLYTVKFDWNSNKKHYHAEQTFTIL
jgi:nitrogen fixation protein FixH